MTVSELMQEVQTLGFDESLSNETLLTVSANRALRDLYSRRAITRTVRLFAQGLKPTTYIKEIHCKHGESKTLPFVGRAYSMRVCGTGNYAITDGVTTSNRQFDTGKESRLVRGFITWGGSIRFWGSFSFSIYDFSVYDEAFSSIATNIPDGGATDVFDIRDMYGDFMSFITPVTDGYGTPISGCILRDGRLEVNSDYRGEMILTYRRLPTLLEAGVEADIDVPEEYVHLFPLLVASYVLLDIDPEKADYYKARYEEMMSNTIRGGYGEISSDYTNVNGWA